VKLSDFRYDLPEQLIAQVPLSKRDASSMLLLDRRTGATSHHGFADLPALLTGKELIVYNDTRVIPARIWARKPSGGRVEVLALRVLSDHTFEAMTRSSRALRQGIDLTTDRSGRTLRIVSIPEPGRAVIETAGGQGALELVLAEGKTPLPPYIKRLPEGDDADDRLRYQTMFAALDGSVAAPTAGLHFTPLIVRQLRQRGCRLVPITLHVGPGTFQPVRVENVEKHIMEREFFELSETSAREINRAREQGRPVMAVGTTSVRCLESVGRTGKVVAGKGDTELFIYPGYEFKIVDRLFTNFHLPGSSLIMLVSALAGRKNVLAAYREAVARKYRFYSYGDCMLVV